MLLVTLGSAGRLVDRRESLGDLPDPGQALRQPAEEGGVVRDEAGLAQLGERGTKQLESGADSAGVWLVRSIVGRLNRAAWRASDVGPSLRRGTS
jgi:hypothetical protein